MPGKELAVPTQGAWVVDSNGMTIEDVAASVAPRGALVAGLVHNRKDTGIGAPIPVGPRVVLTPRSAEACLIEGVDPRDLYLRPLDTFTWGKFADQAVARMRQDVYNRLREEKLDAVRRARNALIRGELPADLGLSKSTRTALPEKLGVGPELGVSPKKLVALDPGPLEAEAQRLAGVQRRHQRELAQLIANEMRLADTLKSAAEQEASDAGKHDDREAAVVARKKMQAEERRIRELKKRLAEDEERERQRAMVADAMKRDKMLEDEEARKKDARARAATEKELMRQQKQLEHEEAAKKKEAEAAASVLERQAQLALAASERAAKQAAANAEREAAAEERRKLAEARIEANKRQAEELERKRLADMDARARAVEARREEREKVRQAEIRAKAMEAFLEAKHRKLTAATAARDDDTRKTLLEMRMAAEAEAQARLQEAEEREAALKREKGALEEQAKRDAVERAKAKDAYRRLVTMRGIEDKLARAEVRDRSKKEAARLRREMNAAALRQKHKVLQTMESMAMQGKKDFEGAQREFAALLSSGTDSVLKATLGRRLGSPRGGSGASPPRSAAASFRQASPLRADPAPGVPTTLDVFLTGAGEQGGFEGGGGGGLAGGGGLGGGAGLLWGAGTATAGATPGAAGAPTGLFFSAGPAMQAFLAQKAATEGGMSQLAAIGLAPGGVSLRPSAPASAGAYLSYGK